MSDDITTPEALDALRICTFCRESRNDLTLSDDGQTTICGDCRGEAEVAS